MSFLIELIQIAIGKKKQLWSIPSDKEWENTFFEAEKQAVIGVAFDGLQKLPPEQYPPQSLLLQWIGMSEQIKAQNKLANQRTIELYYMFSKAGFRCCILKGQGNALMYPNLYSRNSGDIDIWIDDSRNKIRDYVKSRWTKTQDGNQHIGIDVFPDVPVEVHYTPSILINPKYNKRFQNFIRGQKKRQFSNLTCFPDSADFFCVPTLLFNVVYQMSHIMSHFFVEGIGLRHFIDYYYVLLNFKKDSLWDKGNCEELFKYLGMRKFAQGVMWVENKYLGLETDFLLIEPDKRIGKIIMTEMLEGGNFGFYDERYRMRKLGYLARGLTDCYRLIRLSSVFPVESMWKLYDKIKNQRWKLQ